MTGMFNTYYDLSKLTLWAEGSVEKTRARLVISMRDGNPRIVVYPGEKGVIINFPCDYIVMCAIMDRIMDIADRPNGAKMSITSKTLNWVDGKRTNDIRLVSTLHIGKNKDGIIYLLVKEEKKPDVVFAFRKNEWHDFIDESKQEVPEAEMSRQYAKAFAFLTKNALAQMLQEYQSDAYRFGEFKPTPIKPTNVDAFSKPKSNNVSSYDLPMEDIAF